MAAGKQVGIKQQPTERLPCGCVAGVGSTKHMLYQPCDQVRERYEQTQELARKGMGLSAVERQQLADSQAELRKHMGSSRSKRTRRSRRR